MTPQTVLSDEKGNIFAHPKLKMMVSSGGDYRLPQPRELITLPRGSRIFYMPAHQAVGWDEDSRCPVCIENFQGESVFPVAAHPVPGYVRLHLPAAQKTDKRLRLPLWAYTAVGWLKGRFCVACRRVDKMRKHRPLGPAEHREVEKNMAGMLKRFPRNRLVRHLARCASLYQCPNAFNLFLNKGEAPLPVSPVCNARCLGCLSYQGSDCTEASQERINFIPTPEEIFEVAFFHLKNARSPLVSFGQGCEGEPLLQFATLKKAIRLIRSRTQRGTIHLNTNGFSCDYIRALAAEGLDSIRISLNSLSGDLYRAYYRPRHFGLKSVVASVQAAAQSGLFVSLNLLVFPGVTDTQAEASRLVTFLKKGHVRLLQLRNLSIDSDFYFKQILGHRLGSPLGVLQLIRLLRRRYPHLRLGYFNIPKESF